MVDVDLAHLGRRVVKDGLLVQLREQLGLTRTAMADMLQTSPLNYVHWETKGDRMRLWDTTSERIGRFYLHAERQLDTLDRAGISMEGLVPLFMVAGRLGVSHATLLSMYRDEMFHAEDLGILGLWVHEADLPEISEGL